MHAGSRTHWSLWPSKVAVAEKAMKASTASHQKHSLRGCTIDMTPSTCRQISGVYRFAARYLAVLACVSNQCVNDVSRSTVWL